jgi:hypothetical protein
MISLEKASAAHPRIDLLHIDIQGGEADLIRDSLAILNKKVAYMTIGPTPGRSRKNLRKPGGRMVLKSNGRRFCLKWCPTGDC